MEKEKILMPVVLAVMFCMLLGCSTFADYLVYDNFDRADTTDGVLGSTLAVDGATSYTWDDNGVTTVNINDNTLAFSDYSGTHGAAVGGFTTADGIISVDIVTINEVKPLGVTYRTRTETIARDIYATDRDSRTSQDGYSVQLYGGPSAITRVLIYRNGGYIADQQGLSISLDTPVNLTVEFEGNHHVVTVGGTVIFDYTDTDADAFSTAGYTGIASAYTAASVDNYSISAVPEPCTLGLIGVGSMVFLKRKHK